MPPMPPMPPIPPMSGIPPPPFFSSTCSATMASVVSIRPATEAAFCWLLLSESAPARLPPHVWDGEPDPALAPLKLFTPDNPPRVHRIADSNSFAFGGSNICVVLERS